VSYTYNRMGKQKSVTDAAGSRVFDYTDNLQLDLKAASGIYSNVMKRDYSTSGYTRVGAWKQHLIECTTSTH